MPRRNKCFRCGETAEYTWNICADNNKVRRICLKCDIKLNEFVLMFMGFPDWKEKIDKYKELKLL